MKKKTKTMRKGLSIFLVLLIVTQILPLQVLAENITDAIAHQQFINDVVNNPTSEDDTSNAEILYEVEEKRDEYTKVYKKSDGTYTAIMTEEPLHYLYNGVWEEINNSMSLNGNLYTNLDNLFNVEFPESIDSNENLTVEKDGYALSFSVDNIEESSAVVENDIVVSDTNIPVADEAISQTQSSVTYNDVAENTDLQYIVTPNSIKENIIVSSRESVKDTYTFTFETNGLDAEKLDDGSVVFKDDNDDVKFRIPRPVMTDAGLAFSYDIIVNLIKNADKTITLEYSPSSEWTNNSDRIYPITIDPAITIDGEEPDFIEDTCVEYNSDVPNLIYQNNSDAPLAAVVNMQTGENRDGTTTTLDSEIYTRIDTDYFNNLGKNIVFTEVQYLFAGVTSADGKLLAREILEDWDVNTVTYDTKPQLSNETIDYYTSPLSNGEEFDNFVFVHFNITSVFNEWFNGKTNNGFAITAVDDAIAIMMINGGTQSTAMILDYVDIGGYNENLSYHSQFVGKAGTGYVNDFTQQLSVIRDDVVIDENIPLAIGMTYNSSSYDKLKSLNRTNMLAYGNNWLPNFLRAYLSYDEDKFTYYTDTGSTIDFIRSTDIFGNVTFKESYSSEYGHHNYSVEYYPASNGNNSYYTVIRPDGLIEKFNNYGLLVSLINPNTMEEVILVSYDSLLRIENIVIGSTYKAEYKYSDNNLLSKIEIKRMTSPLSQPDTITYTYDTSNNLIGVKSYDGELFEYSYDNNNNIISITHINNNRVEYEYDTNGKIYKVTEQVYNGTEYESGNIFTYDCLSTTQIKVTDQNDDYIIYHFNNQGSLLYTIDGSQSIQSTITEESNYVANNGFENGLTNWVTKDNITTTPSTIYGQSICAAEFPGGADTDNVIYQTISIDGKKNDTIAVAGWFKGCFTNSSTNNSFLKNLIEESENSKICNFTNDRYAQMEVVYQYKVKDDDREKIAEERVVIPFPENISDWQYTSGGFTLKGDCETITLFIRYSKNANKAYFSNIELIKNDGYELQYDDGQLLGMSLGLRDVISYTYNADGYVTGVSYIDSDNKKTVTRIEYNNNSKPIQIKENGTPKYNFSYENGVLSSISSADNRIIRYTDDFGGISSFTNSHFYSIKNENGNPVEILDEKEYKTKLYDVDYNVYGTSVEKSEVFVENNNAINISSTQDWYGRRSSNIVSTKNDLVKVESTFGYDEENTEFDTLNQVKIYTNNIYSETRNNGFPSNKSFFYEYDENSNIIKEYDYLSKNSMELRYSYAYDLDNRLIRYNDNVSEPNRSYSYEYDSDGNLVSKSTYTYTPLETELGEPISTEYYNAIPTSLDDATLTWNGQQLESYERTDDNTNTTTRVEYCYDENGLMTEKKVYVDNVLDETYYYTWAYGKLTNEVYIKEGAQQTKHTIKYVYDSFNSVQGFILDHTDTFLFLKNLYGDIFGVVDNSGNIVVSCEYDVWGVPTIICNDNEILSSSIIKTLPLAYRGCCYDYYSGLYYVEGRYYNPKVGNFVNSSATDNNDGLSESPANYSLFTYWENHPLWYADSNIKETINANSIANYLHNKQVTNNLTDYFESNNGFIFNQTANEMHQYRFGFNHVGNVGCGLVATYNTLLLLENQTESHNIIPMYFHDVIRECEQIGLFAYNMGVHPFAIAQFFIKKNYDVNIIFSDFDDIVDDENIENMVNIMHYTHCGGTHYVAIKYENQKFKGYNAFCNKTTFDEFDSIATLENGNNTYQGKILISISK